MSLPAGDPYWSSVSCLLHMNDTGLTDVKGNTVTLTGNVARSATQSKFGGYSAVFDGSGDYLGLGTSTIFDLSTSDFTIEFFAYVTTTTMYYAISRRPANGWLITMAGGGSVTWNQWASGGTYNFATGPASSFTQNAWNHVAICRSGNDVKVYVNGSGGTALSSANRPDSASGTFYIGQDPTTPAKAFAGYIDEFRFTKGVARYSGDFTAPTIPYPDTYLRISGETKNSSGTLSPRVVRVMRCSDNSLAGSVLSDYSTGQYVVTALDSTPHYAVCHSDLFDPYWSSTVLLMHMDSTGLTDEKGKAITLAGGAARSATQSKFGGYSAYFDGTGDYLTTPDSADFAFGSGDFTIECYFKQGATGGTYALCAQRTNTTTSYSFAFQITGSTITFIGSTSGTGTTHTVTAAYTQETSNWHHAAVVRSGTVLTVFADGVPGTSVGIGAAALFDSAAVLSIGGDTTGSSNQFNGYIDDLRITKGVARYTTTFTPHTAAHPHAYSATENAQIYDNITPY